MFNKIEKNLCQREDRGSSPPESNQGSARFAPAQMVRALENFRRMAAAAAARKPTVPSRGRALAKQRESGRWFEVVVQYIGNYGVRTH